MPIPLTLSHVEAAETLSALLAHRKLIRAAMQSLEEQKRLLCPTAAKKLDEGLLVLIRCSNAVSTASLKIAKAVEAVDGAPPRIPGQRLEDLTLVAVPVAVPASGIGPANGPSPEDEVSPEPPVLPEDEKVS